MKLAWLCYTDDPDYLEVLVKFERPDCWRYSKVVQIVYAEIEE